MSDPARQDWDVIVIGTGMGGGIAGRRLAEAGLRVLFVEKGPAGHRAERQGLDPSVVLPEARLARGYWPEMLRARLDGRESVFHGPIGAGVGGSSVFYAGTLERPAPHDLDDSAERPHPTGGWPVSWAEMRPWFDTAEAMLEISGTPDPLAAEVDRGTLREPPEMNAADRLLAERFTRAGLHPYHAHSAIRQVEGCLSCLGRKCPKRCKMDGRSAGVEPALETGRAALIDRCEVTAIRGEGRRVTRLEALRAGERIELAARHVVLAAGALGSPHLLLRSTQDWTAGCANGSDMVGRNLMFHLNEMLAIWPGRAAAGSGPSKSLSLRDLYWLDGQRFGTLQSMGIDAGYGEILHYLRGALARSRFAHVPALGELARLPAAMAARMLGEAKVFVGLLEDLGLPENRVRFDPAHPGAPSFDYSIPDELKRRRRAFRRAIRRALRGQRMMFLTHAPEPNFGHPSGTLRMGEDPARSVLNAEGRAHDLDNLWVADASFMPSSMGVNPSLTIAAHALRVADRIAARHRQEEAA
ncbi:FAD-binding protein [Aquicoccus sp. SCR17]|nr:FAD-binding protein [Carideicomes alvinocaridis]